MSKKKHRGRSSRSNDNMNSQNGTYNNQSGNPFGINPAQLLSLLGANDMSQLGNMINTMGRDGFDLSGLGNMFPNMNNMGQFNSGNNQNTYQEQNMQGNSNFEDNDVDEEEDKYRIDDDNMEFLKSLRVIADPKRREFIDQIIAKYLDGDFED